MSSNVIEIIEKSQCKTTNWSGGTTTELYIYPKTSLYSERNFIWRLSSAKVENEESTFTPLPNISRILMILEGDLQLEHEGHHKCHLKAFEQDNFLGNWTTKSFGKVTDFNLMMAPGCSGNVEAMLINSNDNKHLNFSNNTMDDCNHFNVFYVYEGEIQISYNDTSTELHSGDLFVININNIDDDFSIDLLCKSNCKIIKSDIVLN